MEDLKKVFAGKLLGIKAIKLQPNDPFTWASGWKSPFYCDNRKTLSFHDVRSFVKLELVHAILENFPEATAVAGVATGAIAQGMLVADELALPYAYVRPKPKDHGMKNQIEGELPAGSKVVVVEDLISTGGSSLKAVAALRSGGVNEGNRSDVNAQVNTAFGRLFPQVEAYPELKAHNAIADAMQQNNYLQREITAARTVYNSRVTQWNTDIFSWPTKMIVAAQQGYTTRIPFTATAETREAARGKFF